MHRASFYFLVKQTLISIKSIDLIGIMERFKSNNVLSGRRAGIQLVWADNTWDALANMIMDRLLSLRGYPQANTIVQLM
jgi:hypothetical protein